MDRKGRNNEEEISGSKRNMFGYILTRWDFNFCVRSSPLRGFGAEKTQGAISPFYGDAGDVLVPSGIIIKMGNAGADDAGLEEGVVQSVEEIGAVFRMVLMLRI